MGRHKATDERACVGGTDILPCPLINKFNNIICAGNNENIGIIGSRDNDGGSL